MFILCLSLSISYPHLSTYLCVFIYLSTYLSIFIYIIISFNFSTGNQLFQKQRVFLLFLTYSFFNCNLLSFTFPRPPFPNTHTHHQYPGHLRALPHLIQFSRIFVFIDVQIKPLRTHSAPTSPPLHCVVPSTRNSTLGFFIT